MRSRLARRQIEPGAVLSPSHRETAGAHMSAGPVLGLQRAIGNQAVQRLMAQREPTDSAPQTIALSRLAPPPTPPSTRAERVQRRGDEVLAGSARANEPAVQREAVAGPVLQRAGEPATTAGQRPPLRSPRFAGDAVLEACHQDKARLAQGSPRGSVVKVQQALIDLGFDLGKGGADGIYGAATSAAVRAFKKQEQLGFEQFGDVGPGTMARLDQLFPPGPVPPTPPTPTEEPPNRAEEEDGGPLSCPAPDDVVAAIESEPALATGVERSLAVTRAPTVGAPNVGAPTGAPAHVGITEIVKRFKDKIDAKTPAGTRATGTNISTSGQFFVTGLLRDAVDSEIVVIDSPGDPDSVKFASRARAAVSAIQAADFDKADAAIADCDKIAKSTSSSRKSSMQALLKPAGKGGAIDAALFAAFNASTNDTVPQSMVTKFRSLRALRAVKSFDVTACGNHAGRIAERIKKKGGLVTIQAKGPTMSAVLATGSGFNDMRPMLSPSSTREPAATSGLLPGGGEVFGDVIGQSGASSAASQLRKVLDAGGTVHARVLSGLGYGKGTTAKGVTKPNDKAKRDTTIGAPPEEHSLLIIGYDGDKFVFHDPDASVSKSPEAGFGFLFLDSGDGRLSTAEKPSDMVVNSDGVHRGGDKRYQVIKLNSF